MTITFFNRPIRTKTKHYDRLFNCSIVWFSDHITTRIHLSCPFRQRILLGLEQRGENSNRDHDQRACRSRLHCLFRLPQLQVRRLPTHVGSRSRRPRHSYPRLGRRERHSVLARGQLMEPRLGRQRLLQDPEGQQRVRHWVGGCRRTAQAVKIFEIFLIFLIPSLLNFFLRKTDFCTTSN